MERIRQEDRLETVLQMFAHYHCHPNTLLTKPALLEILDRQSNRMSQHPFNPNIADELFGQAQTLSKGQSTVLIISKIICEALSILEKRIANLQDPRNGLPSKQQQLSSRQKTLQTLQQEEERGYEQNGDKINTARKNINILQTKINELERIADDFQKEHRQLACCLQTNDSTQLDRTYFVPPAQATPQAEQPGPSLQLTIIFAATLFALLLEFELLLFSFRPNFLALLSEALTIYWLFYGYYDQHSVKYLMAATGLSSLLDIVYLCLFLLKQVGTTRYSGEDITTIVLITLLALAIAARLFVLTQLVRYRQPANEMEYFQLFGHRMYLQLRSGKQWT